MLLIVIFLAESFFFIFVLFLEFTKDFLGVLFVIIDYYVFSKRKRKKKEREMEIKWGMKKYLLSKRSLSLSSSWSSNLFLKRMERACSGFMIYL